MNNRHPPRKLVLLLAAQLVLAASSATAHSPLPPGGWPEPKPTQWPAPVPMPVAHTVPNFQAPSAPHCARPVQTREVPGAYAEQAMGRRDLRDRMAKSAPAIAEDAGTSGRAMAPAAPAARAESGRGMADAARESLASSAHPMPPPVFPLPQPQPQQAPNHGPVTAGVVDDNADFTSYLAFRNRTRVQHRARDIRERYLLEVKDARGRGIADAEVAVQGSNGPAMWARTDAAGQVWLHPNAFDPSRSHQYDVAVRKDG